MCELIKPEGAIASITENRRPINLRMLTKKKATFAWEWMYTKSYYHTSNMQTQHDILDTISTQLDEHKLKCTLTRTLSPLNAINLRRAHSLVESGHMIGKVVITNEKAQLFSHITTTKFHTTFSLQQFLLLGSIFNKQPLRNIDIASPCILQSEYRGS